MLVQRRNLLLQVAAWMAVAGLLTTLSTPAMALERFFGKFEGQAVVGGGGEVSPRDISVTVTKKGRGFTLEWTAVIHKASGKTKRAEYTIDFLPSKRAGLFRSGMRRNLFGQAVPLDPLKGDPYVWARVVDDTMTVHALLITEEGGYELQIYTRTLTEDGMHLNYFRIKDNEILRTVTGQLKRVE